MGRSVCGVTPSLRTAAIRWWSLLSEPSCTPRTANSSTSSAPEFQVKYRSYICTQPELIKNGCELPLREKRLRDEDIRLPLISYLSKFYYYDPEEEMYLSIKSIRRAVGAEQAAQSQTFLYGGLISTGLPVFQHQPVRVPGNLGPVALGWTHLSVNLDSSKDGECLQLNAANMAALVRPSLQRMKAAMASIPGACLPERNAPYDQSLDISLVKPSSIERRSTILHLDWSS
ncbi:hypothetical protein PAMP_021496 [Pampus punctatissimus]